MRSPSEAQNAVGLMPTASIRERRALNTRAIVLLYILALTLGTVNLYSGSGGAELFYAQLRHIAIGSTLFLICGWLITPRHLHAYAYWLYGIVAALLVAVLTIGKIGGGAQRWVHLGFIGLQPSEPAKIVVAIIVARFFQVSKLNHPYRLRDLWPIMGLVGLFFCLIFPQPDFGTAGFCVIVATAQIVFMKLDRRTLILVAVVIATLVPIVWYFGLQDYQKARIVNFIHPENDVRGTGYNALQSLVAIGSGGLNGKGFMQGTQTQLSFLPKGHTDFVFAVFAEEHGFKGGVVLFLIFGGFAYVGLEIARQARDTFSALLAVGLSAFIFFEFTINVAMVLRMFPIVGLPLPFFTYGGSILLTVSAALGLLVSIDRDNFGRHRKHSSFGRRREGLKA